MNQDTQPAKAHTPGPLEAFGPYVTCRTRQLQLAVCTNQGVSEDEACANAMLYAAAPDLLAALLNIENDDNRIPAVIWDMRNAAIARATGGTK